MSILDEKDAYVCFSLLRKLRTDAGINDWPGCDNRDVELMYQHFMERLDAAALLELQRLLEQDDAAAF